MMQQKSTWVGWSTCTCVLNAYPPTVSRNGLQVTKTRVFKHGEGLDIILLKVEITSHYTKPRGVQANMGGNCTKQTVVFLKLVRMPSAGSFSIYGASGDPHVLDKAGGHQSAAGMFDAIIPTNWLCTSGMFGQCSHPFPTTGRSPVQSYGNRISTGNVLKVRLCDPQAIAGTEGGCSPKPSFVIITGTPEQPSNLRELRIEHRLEVLLLSLGNRFLLHTWFSMVFSFNCLKVIVFLIFFF